MTQSLLDARDDAAALFAAPARGELERIALARAGNRQRSPRPGPGRRRDRLPARALRRAGPRSGRRRTDDVRAGQLRALPPQDLQRHAGPSTAASSAQSLFKMIKHTHAQTPQHTLSAYSDNAAVVEGYADAALPPGSGDAARTAAKPSSRVGVLHQGRNPQPSDRDRAVPGRAHRQRRRDPRRGRDRPRRQARRPACAASASRTCASRRCRSRGKATRSLNPRMAPALEIMLDGPIGAAAFNNEFGRPNLTGYFRSFELDEGDATDARLRQADHARRRPGRHRPHPGRKARPEARAMR